MASALFSARYSCARPPRPPCLSAPADHTRSPVRRPADKPLPKRDRHGASSSTKWCKFGFKGYLAVDVSFHARRHNLLRPTRAVQSGSIYTIDWWIGRGSGQCQEGVMRGLRCIRRGSGRGQEGRGSGGGLEGI
eukprot:1176569-Prorocentrum_minimum.AAC.1